MRWRNTIEEFGTVGKVLHWLVVLGIIGAYLLAEAAEHDEGSGMMLHRSIGITILGLAILRVAWRLLDRRPAWPPTMTRPERLLAGATHVALYAVLFALPLTGWLLSSAEGDAVRYFGFFELPPLRSGADEDAFEDLHEGLFNVLLGLAALHVAGALKHHVWDRDGVMRSMLPGRRP